MCSVFGFQSRLELNGSVVSAALKQMEYRGYDSCGIYLKNQILKGTYSVEEMSTQQGWASLNGSHGLGHTRWATNGSPTTVNAHPHTDKTGKVVVVHNGIISNAAKIKKQYNLKHESDTDTGVLVEFLANRYLRRHNKVHDVFDTILDCFNHIEGDYSFIADFEGTVVAVNNGKPLIVGLDPYTCYAASDVLAFTDLTDQVIYLPYGSFYYLGQRKAYDSFGYNLEVEQEEISKEFTSAYKEEYASFTEKEIMEQRQVIDQPKNNINALRLEGKTYVVGSGSSFNAAAFSTHLFNWIPIVASEYKFNKIIKPGANVILISQSGESQDVIDVAKDAKEKGCHLVGLLNIKNSSIGRLCDEVTEINCGPEVGVAATKSFTSQLATILEVFGLKGFSDNFHWPNFCLENTAEKLAELEHIYVIGRGLHYPIAREAALKIKEMCYIHAEAIQGGEVKHGPLALLNEDSWAICLNPTDNTYEDTLKTISQLKARNINVIGVSNKNNKLYDKFIKIKESRDIVYALAEIFPLQILAYEMARRRNIDPDRPRNLAKSVTVE
jgi:glucosamine--fructose-6-phosphate aminotransferase (isomerizing)